MRVNTRYLNSTRGTSSCGDVFRALINSPVLILREHSWPHSVSDVGAVGWSRPLLLGCGHSFASSHSLPGVWQCAFLSNSYLLSEIALGWVFFMSLCRTLCEHNSVCVCVCDPLCVCVCDPLCVGVCDPLSVSVCVCVYVKKTQLFVSCLLYTSPSPRDFG